VVASIAVANLAFVARHAMKRPRTHRAARLSERNRRLRSLARFCWRRLSGEALRGITRPVSRDLRPRNHRRPPKRPTRDWFRVIECESFRTRDCYADRMACTILGYGRSTPVWRMTPIAGTLSRHHVTSAHRGGRSRVSLFLPNRGVNLDPNGQMLRPNTLQTMNENGTRGDIESSSRPPIRRP